MATISYAHVLHEIEKRISSNVEKKTVFDHIVSGTEIEVVSPHHKNDDKHEHEQFRYCPQWR
jgi:hypothetical protein